MSRVDFGFTLGFILHCIGIHGMHHDRVHSIYVSIQKYPANQRQPGGIESKELGAAMWHREAKARKGDAVHERL